MKKLSVAMLIAVSVLAVGCGSTQGEQTAPNTSETEEAESDMTDVGEQDEDEEEKTAETEETEEEEKKPAMISDQGTIEETVLYDEKDVRIVAEDLTYGESEVELSLLIENNTDQNLNFVSGSMGYSCNAVNGYAVSSGYDNEDIPSGKKVKASIDFDTDELKALGITQIAEITIGYQVDNEDYDSYLATGPMNLSTSLADSVDTSVDTFQNAVKDGSFEAATGVKILNSAKDGLFSSDTISVTSAFSVQRDNGYDCILELCNPSNETEIFTCGDVAINGCVLTSSNWENITLTPGGRGILVMDLPNMVSSDAYKNLDLGEITDIAFTGNVYDMDGNALAKELAISVAFGERVDTAEENALVLYDADGIRITYAGHTSDDTDENYQLKVYNTSDYSVNISEVYDSISINGYMIDGLVDSRNLAPGQSAGVEIEISQSDLEDNDITAEDVKEVTASLEIESENGNTAQADLTIENP